MNVKELKEFLKDIDDNFEVACLKIKYNESSLHPIVLDVMHKEDIYIDNLSEVLRFGGKIDS